MKFKPFPELTNILLPKQCKTYGEISAKPPTLNFAKRAWFEIRVQQDDAIRWNDGMAEWRNILQRRMPFCMKQSLTKMEWQ